jgi:hypothetical protein
VFHTDRDSALEQVLQRREAGYNFRTYAILLPFVKRFSRKLKTDALRKRIEINDIKFPIVNVAILDQSLDEVEEDSTNENYQREDSQSA